MSWQISAHLPTFIRYYYYFFTFIYYNIYFSIFHLIIEKKWAFDQNVMTKNRNLTKIAQKHLKIAVFTSFSQKSRIIVMTNLTLFCPLSLTKSGLFSTKVGRINVLQKIWSNPKWAEPVFWAQKWAENRLKIIIVSTKIEFIVVTLIHLPSTFFEFLYLLSWH